MIALARGDRYNFFSPTGVALVRGIEEGLVPPQGDRHSFISPTGVALVRGIEEGLVPPQGDR
ncbi:MAG: hypothetical protein PHS42_01310 [Sulfurimonas sp.]|nr:hypothetical protein [Sulfurimonas sp.]MDD3834085.1 hypothetical protein [Sulfurimonas sp.]